MVPIIHETIKKVDEWASLDRKLSQSLRSSFPPHLKSCFPPSSPLLPMDNSHEDSPIEMKASPSSSRPESSIWAEDPLNKWYVLSTKCLHCTTTDL